MIETKGELDITVVDIRPSRYGVSVIAEFCGEISMIPPGHAREMGAWLRDYFNEVLLNDADLSPADRTSYRLWAEEMDARLQHAASASEVLAGRWERE